jgi:hypothetical protein
MKGNQKYKIERKDAGIIGVDFILAAILILIVSAMAIAIVFPMIGGIPITATDNALRTAMGAGAGFTPTANASVGLVTTTGTVMGLAPMMALAAVAAGIISILLFAFGSVTRQGL